MVAINKTVENKNTTTKMSLMTGAFLIGFGSYLAWFNISPATNITEPTFKTIRLSQCQNSTANTTSLIEDLQIGHNQLGFAASELIDIARPLERIYLSYLQSSEMQKNNGTNNTTSCNYLNVLPKFSYENVTNFTNNTMESLYNTTLNVTESIQKNGFNTTFTNATANATANVTEYWTNNFNNTANAVQNFTQNTIQNVTECTKNQTMNVFNNTTAIMETVYENIMQKKLRTAFDMEWTKRMNGPKSGALRFSVNDAVVQMKNIFSSCSIVNATQDNNDAILRRFPSANFTQQVADENKTSMTTIIADGWTFESRVVNDLWTNVTVSRGDFNLTLKRDKFGLIHAFANELRMGEI